MHKCVHWGFFKSFMFSSGHNQNWVTCTNEACLRFLSDSWNTQDWNPSIWGCLTANLKKHDVLRLERGSTPQVNSGLSQVRLRVCTLSRGSRVSGDRKGGFYYHFPTSLRINGEKKKPSVWTPTSASFFHERKIRKSDVSLLAPTKIQLHKKRTPFLT